MAWTNKIVDHGDETPDQLLANPANWRIHPLSQQAALKAAIESVGYIQPVIVNRETGHLIDGHLRVMLAMREGIESIPVSYVQLTADEEALALATLDPLAAMAATDSEKLLDLLHDVHTDDEALQAMLADLVGDAALAGAPESDADAEPQDDRAEELRAQWGTERGQVWTIGDHRLMCGDSTNADDVARLMGGEKAEMMFTDPPYGVNYEGGHFHSGDVNIKRSREKIAADDNTQIYFDFLPVALPVVDGPCYMWFAGSRARDVYNALHDCNCEVHALIIWHKTNATYAAMNAQYKQRHEPCLYFKPKGSTLRWCGASTEATIWSEDRDGINEFHPTQKPITLASKAMRNHEASIVLDPFLGSGTTMVAAQNLSRKCYGMEISPAYCAVILQRMTDAFPGIEIALDGRTMKQNAGK